MFTYKKDSYKSFALSPKFCSADLYNITEATPVKKKKRCHSLTGLLNFPKPFV